MSEIEEIEARVRKLSSDAFAQFSDWFHQFESELWDRQIEGDFASGKFEASIAKAREEFAQGKAREL